MISLKGFITGEVRAEPITTHLASASGQTYDAFAAVRFSVHPQLARIASRFSALQEFRHNLQELPGDGPRLCVLAVFC